jgi:hypothetical protein
VEGGGIGFLGGLGWFEGMRLCIGDMEAILCCRQAKANQLPRT